MSSYKLIQDIEAEDHILGPLSLRQFIFALVAVFCFYLCFIAVTKHAGFLLVAFLPPGLFCAFFAFPFGKDQPTEVWALAKIRFLFKPRRRIWDQSGVKELVTITAPKKIETVLTNGLSQNEVQSRLTALANTIDSRGWAIKNVNVNTYSQPNPLATQNSDRLIDIASMPQEVPNFEVRPDEDILDETSNPIAQQFDHMITESTQAHHRQLVNEFNNVAGSAPSAPVDYWFMNQPAMPANTPPDQTMFNTQVVQPGSTAASIAGPVASADDEALAAQLKAQHGGRDGSYAHLRTIQPLGSDQPQPPITTSQPAPAVVPNNSVPVPGAAAPDPAILSLANNNDLNVATLARQAQKTKDDGKLSDGEVVISLH
ncbi:MAG TPA: PrgI family protein [Verrucomicrobiae bacterium]|jgi:hypothetical protein|nr:PrgI family protein [Verrucomicrobiae bacterium]